MNDPMITLRPVTDDDIPFLLHLYGTTRADELARVVWSPAEKDAFVRQQFAAQHHYWREQRPHAAFDIVLLDGVSAGRFYVDRSADDDIRIVDIALLPEYRGLGVGSRLIRELFAEADRAARPVSIHVEMFNPARRLYERLGFAAVEERGVYLFMTRMPRGQLSAVS